MNFVTKSVTTNFLSSIPFYIHTLRAYFLPLFIVEGGIYMGLIVTKRGLTI